MNAIATIANTYTYISIGEAGAPVPFPPPPPPPGNEAGCTSGCGGVSAFTRDIIVRKKPILVY